MVGFLGDFDHFADAFPDALVPTVLAFMLREWPNAPRPESSPLENRITNRFVGHLKRVLRKENTPLFRIDYRPKIADPESDSEIGEIDIQIASFSCHQDAILIVECKCLNVEYASGFASRAGDYVGIEGMGCFVSEQYKSGGFVGAMMGYVMSRTIDDAMASINEQLNETHAALRMSEPHRLRDSTLLPDVPQAKQTTHTLTRGNFEIVHLFVEFGTSN